jgi:uncharacterized surface protein with fasciclin (FAS1) repeats
MFSKSSPALALAGVFVLAGCAESPVESDLSTLETAGLTASETVLESRAPAPGAAISAETALNNRAPAPGTTSIVEIVVGATEAAEPEFTLLLAAIGYIAETHPESPLVAGLFDRNQYTVFAPTDQAFENLVTAVAPLLDADILAAEGPFAAIDALLGAGTIEAVVSYHVTNGRRAANSVLPPGRSPQPRKIQTLLSGASFNVSSGGLITAVGNTATLVAADLSASNGIIHVIDAVILPVDLGL